ncbi:hypothetical protein PG995_013196 [Apiospora arundinis]
MNGLQAFPTEVLNLIIEQLVLGIGIQKLVLLRTVNRAFDASILHTICVSQIVGIDDPATRGLAQRMPPWLRGKVLAVKSRSVTGADTSYLSVIARVNQSLDSLINEDEGMRTSRHEAVAGAVLLVQGEPVDHSVEALNILSGAVVSGNLGVVASLLQQNEHSSIPVGVNDTTPYFPNLLTLAATAGHLEMVRYLLGCGARLHSVLSSPDYQRYRHQDLATWHAQSEIIRSLTLHMKPRSALRTAVFGGHGDIVHLFLRPEHRLPTDHVEYLSAIVAGAKAGRIDLIDALFEAIGKKLADMPGLENEMMWAATRYNQQHVVQKLLDEGADINAFPDEHIRPCHSALHIAASLGNISMVRFLIERGADVHLNGVNSFGHLPIEGAARSGQKEVVELLIDEHGADPASALHSAAKGCQSRLIKYLLERFPDLPFGNAGEDGYVAFLRALAGKNLRALTLLVEAGVDVNDDRFGVPYEEANNAGLGGWVCKHLISLGARNSGGDTYRDEQNSHVRDVLVSERTWDWAGKY